MYMIRLESTQDLFISKICYKVLHCVESLKQFVLSTVVIVFRGKLSQYFGMDHLLLIQVLIYLRKCHLLSKDESLILMMKSYH